jgi:predicted aspartyl protease
MENYYPFEWLEDDGIIVVDVKLNQKNWLRFLLDTGASASCIDLNMLVIEQVSFKEKLEQVNVETANGWIIADVFRLHEFEVFGLQLPDFPIQSIDFIAHGIISDYHGVLGMDVLTQRNLCVHFEERMISFR